MEESSKELSIEKTHSFDLSFGLHIDHLKHSRLTLPNTSGIRERRIPGMERSIHAALHHLGGWVREWRSLI